MLWGDGEVSSGDALRYQEFLNLTTTPQYILGFEEPDCAPPDSSDIATGKGAQVWNDVIAPWNKSGSLLGSPSMCSMSIFLSLCMSLAKM
jgi:Glycosyl hydrolase catalytic core